MMNLDAKIYVAGHRGLVGSAIVRELRGAGYRNIILRTRAELDLTNEAAVRGFFAIQRPEYVFLAAAKVGGIFANGKYPADFIFQNLSIQTNVIESAYQTGVHRLLFLGSSCIYPKMAIQPMPETALLSGPLEPTNRPYALAKIAGIEMCWAYNRQYGTRNLAVMPANLYGPGDNYDPETSHVIPALMRNLHESKIKRRSEALIWGTGKPRREFLFSDDLANACVFLMNLDQGSFDSLVSSESDTPIINIGYGQDQTILELAEMIAEIVGFGGALSFDTDKPDGAPRKLLDTSRLSALGWAPQTPLRVGIEFAYEEFLESFGPMPALVLASSSGTNQPGRETNTPGAE
jgi:GDP-L-fucose synthase